MATASSDSAQLAKLQINIESNIKSVFDSFQKLFKIVKQADKDGFTPIRKNSDNWKKNVEGIEKTQKGINVQMKQYNDTTAKSSKHMQGLQKNAEAIKTAFSFLKGRAGLLVGGFGIGAMVSGTKAWRTELLALNETFSSMSDATGSTNAAMGVYFNALGKTKAGQQTVIASMKALEDQGLKVGKEFADLTVLGADLSQATGISADTWGNLTGKLNFSWKVPVEGIKKINSALISTGLTGSQLTQVINGVNENIDKLAGFAKDGTKNAIALAAGYAGATKALTKFGISTQKATEFMNKLLDPEHLQDNMLLLAKAGISYSDFTNMLTSDKGKETFFDKLGAGLPRVAQQLQQIQDPISRMNFAKSLGLSTEMVAKLASAGPGEMQKIMREAVNEAKSKDALDKKQKASKEAAAKLDERLHLMRMQLFSGLLPIFERNLPKFMNILNLVFQRGGDIFTFIGKRVEAIFNGLSGTFESVLKGDWDKIPGKMGEGFKNITLDIMGAVSNTLMPMVSKFIWMAIPNMIKGFGAAIKGIWEASPFMGILATLYAGNKIFGPILQKAWELKKYLVERQEHKEIIATFMGKKTVGNIGENNATGMLDMLFGKGTPLQKGINSMGSAIGSTANKMKTGIGSSIKNVMYGKEEWDGVSLQRSGGLADSKIGKTIGKGGKAIGRGLRGAGKMLKGLPGIGMALSAVDIGMSAMSGDMEGIAGGVGTAIGGAIGAVLGGPVGAAAGAAIGDYIGKKVYKDYKDMQEAQKNAFFKTESQANKLSSKQYDDITGLNMKGNKEASKFASGMMYKDLSEKATEGNISQTKKASIPGMGLESSKTEMAVFQGMVAQRKISYMEDAKMAAEQLQMHKDGRKQLSAEAKAMFEEMVENEKNYKSFNTLSQFTDLEIKMKAGKDLTEEEKKRYDKLKELQVRASQELTAEGAKYQNIFRANFKNVSKDMIKSMDSLFETLGGTISTGIGEIKKGLLMASAEISQIGFGFSIGGFSIGSDKHHMGQVIAKGSGEFMRQELDKIKNLSNSQQVTALQNLEKKLRSGNEAAGEGKAIFATHKAFQDIMTKEGMSPAELKKALADNYADADKARNTIADSIAAQLEVAKQQLKNEKKMAGSLASIDNKTEKKIERANVNNWVDFLRNSGMVEAGVY